MPSQPERDEIDSYLDTVTTRMDHVRTSDEIARHWDAAYGAALTEKDVERITSWNTPMHAMMNCMRSTLADTRLEMEQHLRMYVSRLELDGLPHDDAVKKTLARFGNPRTLGRRICREVSRDCYKRYIESNPRVNSFKDPVSWLRSLIPSTYFIIWTFVPATHIGGVLEANLLGLVPFVLALGFAVLESPKSPSPEFLKEFALAIQKKPDADAATITKVKNFFWRLIVWPPSNSILSPGLIIVSLLTIWAGAMPLTSISRPIYFGLACTCTGAFLGRNMMNALERSGQIAE